MINVDTHVKDFKALYEAKTKEIIEIKKTLNNDLAEIFTKLCKTFFEENPDIELVAWYQGDSGWNDGAPTYFCKQETYCLKKGTTPWLERDVLEYYKGLNRYKETEDWRNVLDMGLSLEEAFNYDNKAEVFDLLPEDFYGDMFGRESQYTVILTKDAIEVLCH